MDVDHAFAVLGLTPGASSPKEVKLQHVKLAWQLHPDRGGDPGAFTRLTEAKDAALAHALAEPCPGCGGAGRSIHQRGFATTTMMCGRCAGTGKRWSNEKS